MADTQINFLHFPIMHWEQDTILHFNRVQKFIMALKTDILKVYIHTIYTNI